jgi:flagellar biosynthesis chaperone FliJ
MLVRLKERRALQHAKEQQLRDALEMDELAILRHPRQSA